MQQWTINAASQHAFKTEFTYDSEFCAHALNSARIFWYFMHMRGKTICEFTVIIEYRVERTDSGRQSRFSPREQMLAWVVDWPSET